MDDRKLEILLTTLRTGSFSKAAQELNCTQSSVTQMMNSLENELNCKILERNHNGIKLTQAGEIMYPLIVEADAGLRRLMEEAKQIAAGHVLPIRIGSFSSISNTWLPRILQEYHEAHSNISFDIRIGTDVISKWLLNGEIDIALGDAERCSAFRWYPLMDDFYYAVLPRSFVDDNKKLIMQKELAEFPFIMAPMNVLDMHLTEVPQKQINVNCDDDSTLLSMVTQGLGVTAMPKLSLQKNIQDVRILELIPETKRVLGVALPNSPSKAAVQFVAFLRKYFNYNE